MKNTKKELLSNNFYEHTGIEKHLEKRAAEGWMLTEIGTFFLHYRRIEPKNLHFKVTYYPKASAFDPEPTEGEQTFREFCEHTGWQMAASSAQMLIFYNELENPTPLETDPMPEIETIHKTAKKTVIVSNLLLLACALLNMSMFVTDFIRRPIRLLSDMGNLITGGVWILLLVVTCVNLISYFVWYKRAVRAAERGEFLDTFDTSRFQKTAIAAAMLLFAGMIIYHTLSARSYAMRAVFLLLAFWVFILFAAVNGVKNYLKRKKVSKRKNFAITLAVDFLLAFLFMGSITWGILYAGSKGVLKNPEVETYEFRGSTFPLYDDELPLTAEELTGIESDDYIKELREKSSPIIGQFEIRQDLRFDAPNYREIPQLSYTITVVKWPFLYDYCKKALLKENDGTGIMDEFYKSVDAEPWGAKEAYRIYNGNVGYWWNEWLLCYDDRFVDFWPQWEEPLTEEQMKLVGERLGR